WQTLVLDRNHQPVPVGVAGELYVGGVGLARGYAGAPDRTAERFVPDPFSSEAGGRLYRTGDRVRWLPGGDLEVLGRIGQQGKITGFRIEPGEVEVVPRDHPDVRDAAVVAREESTDERRLIGYVAPRIGGALSENSLRNLVQAKLPDYMRPATYVFLDALPVT